MGTILPAVLGSALILLGAAYPLLALMRIARLLNDKAQRPSSRQLANRLVLTAALPVGAILGGVGLLLPRLWQNPIFSALVVAAAVVVAACAILLSIRRLR